MALATTAAAELAEALLGPGDWRAAPFGAGKFSETFDVTGPTGRYVLRVAPPDDLRQLFYERRMMRQEPGIHARLLAETSVPVPPIVAHDFSRGRIDRDYLIMPRLPGVPLSEASLGGAARRRALAEWGGYIAQVHAISDPAGRFGYLGEHRCMAPQATWAEAFEVMYRKELGDIVACGIYDEATAGACRQLLAENLGAFDGRASRLLHGDIWVTNVLVAPDGEVTAVLDFDRACWGDVEWDLAIADYCNVTGEAFWSGYGRRIERTDGDAAVRRMFYLLYEHQKYIVISMSRRRGHDEAMARDYAHRSLAAINAFRRTGRPGF